ncbi:uncharacterized protein LOC142411042 [Mycteria americana]|uniref:uncharacterized protein LOC142411042 n=1 Tax=Mycteria americana TaxID=33587 RepID=UPI003F587EEC
MCQQAWSTDSVIQTDQLKGHSHPAAVPRGGTERSRALGPSQLISKGAGAARAPAAPPAPEHDPGAAAFPARLSPRSAQSSRLPSEQRTDRTGRPSTRARLRSGRLSRALATQEPVCDPIRAANQPADEKGLFVAVSLISTDFGGCWDPNKVLSCAPVTSRPGLCLPHTHRSGEPARGLPVLRLARREAGAAAGRAPRRGGAPAQRGTPWLGHPAGRLLQRRRPRRCLRLLRLPVTARGGLRSAPHRTAPHAGAAPAPGSAPRPAPHRRPPAGEPRSALRTRPGPRLRGNGQAAARPGTGARLPPRAGLQRSRAHPRAAPAAPRGGEPGESKRAGAGCQGNARPRPPDVVGSGEPGAPPALERASLASRSHGSSRTPRKGREASPDQTVKGTLGHFSVTEQKSCILEASARAFQDLWPCSPAPVRVVSWAWCWRYLLTGRRCPSLGQPHKAHVHHTPHPN